MAAWWRQIVNRLQPSRATSLSPTHKLGKQGEDLATRHLIDHGYRIIARNVKLTFGEADILAESPDQSTMVLVEVKTRSRRVDQPVLSATIAPEHAVDADKQRTLIRIIQHLAASNGWIGKPLRIDVIAIDWWEDNGQIRPDLRHYTDAVRN
jgi:putative endonuclease